MADRVRVYEEKKKGVPVWAWLLPLLLLLALLAFWFVHNKMNTAGTESMAAQPATTGAYPNLGTIHFATDEATLTPDDQVVLDKAAESMKNNPGAHLRVEGYTDSTGSDNHNLTLSEQRAGAVATYLKSKGVDGSRLTGGGFGKQDPADTNATQSGKADNRRVELFSQQ